MASPFEKAFVGRAFAVLAVCALFALTGCGDDADDGSSASPNQPGSSSATAITGSNGDDGDDAGSDGGSSGGSDADNGSQGDSDDAGFETEPPPIQLFVDGTSDVEVSKPTVRIAKTQNQLDALIRNQSSKSSDRPTVTVNFKEGRQAIALFMPKSPRGSQVTISSVSSNGMQTKVNAVMLVPSKGCKTSGPRDARPTAWVETRRLPGTDVILSVEKTPLSSC